MSPVDLQLVPFAFTVGITASILFYDRFHLSTGSVMVPAYIGLGLMSPWTLVGASITAVVTFWIVHRVLPLCFVMSRLGKFHGVLALSVFLQMAWQHLFPALFPGFPGWLAGVGYVIPGLIAHDMNRQGFAKTLLPIGACSVVVWLALLAVSAFLPDAPPRPAHTPHLALAIKATFIPLALFLSTTASAAFQRHYGLRCGGYVSSAYLGLLMVDPVAIAYVLVAALVTNFIVTQIVAPATILFGRRKFAAMQMIGGIVSWGGLWLGERFAPTAAAAAWCASVPAFVGIVLTGLLANDLEKVGFRRVALGTTLTALFAMFGTLLLIECTESQRPHVILALATGFALCCATVFGPTLQRWWTSFGRVTAGAAPRLTSLKAPSARVPSLVLAAFVVLIGFAPRELLPPGAATFLLFEARANRVEARAAPRTATKDSSATPAAPGKPFGTRESPRTEKVVEHP